MWNGISHAAKAHNLNLVSFIGQALRTPSLDEAQHNTIYNLVSTHQIDGLILMSGIIGSYSTKEELDAFCSQFEDIPIISIPELINGATNILVDNKSGMGRVISHLIEAKGCRRIAFIRGPDKNVEAEERFDAYKITLAAHHIPFDPQLITEGRFIPIYGQLAVHKLLDERNVQFDAIVAANDEMAFGALEALRERGIKVPDEVMVCGFDDTKASQFSLPSLTTVRQPLERMGETAVELLAARLANQDIPSQIILHTESVFRQSTQDFSPTINDAWVDIPSPIIAPFEKTWKTQRPIILHKLADILIDKKLFSEKSITIQIINQLLDAFERDLQEADSEAFLNRLLGNVSQFVSETNSFFIWQQVISTLRRHALDCGLIGDDLICAENIWHQARLLMNEMMQQNYGYHKLVATQRKMKFNDVLNQKRDVFRTLPQGRNGKGQGTDPIIKILAKPPFCHLGLKILVRGGNKPHVHTDFPRSSETKEHPRFDDAKQLSLERKTHVADLVEKQRSPICDFQQAELSGHSPRKGAFFIAEKFTLKHVLRKRIAIQRKKRRFRTRRCPVNETRDNFLPHTAFPMDMHGEVGQRNLSGSFQELPHDRAFKDDNRTNRVLPDLQAPATPEAILRALHGVADE